MLDSLFGSRTRVKLLRLFFTHQDDEYYVREISRNIDEQINSVRRELQNLEEMEMVSSRSRDKKKYYKVNKDHHLFDELKQLVVKSQRYLEQSFVEILEEEGSIEYLLLAGYFVEDPESKIDLFVVGDINREKLDDLLVQFQKNFGHQLRFTVMDKEEFLHRKQVTDKFLYDILGREKIELIDTIHTY